jgi:hypothetical protein
MTGSEVQIQTFQGPKTLGLAICTTTAAFTSLVDTAAKYPHRSLACLQFEQFYVEEHSGKEKGDVNSKADPALN